MYMTYSLPLLILSLNGLSARKLLENNVEQFEEAMREREVDIKDMTRSHRLTLQKIPRNHTGHSSSCPSQCEERRGDGFCDAACNTGHCLYDFGDCSTAIPFCSDHSCPDSSCDWSCALSGCQTGTCRLHPKGRRQFFWAVIPFLNPYKFYNLSTKMEYCLQNQLGLKIQMQADAIGPILYGRREDNLALTRMEWPWTNTVIGDYRTRGRSMLDVHTDHAIDDSTLALFSIDSSSIVTMKDSHIMDRLSRLAAPRVIAKIIPFTLSKEEQEALILPEVHDNNLLHWLRGLRSDDRDWARGICTKN